ncbi:aldo/keto reductase [Bradyrhizobium sp.]|uniref:aldo/keto reductase n=1 Tax=Bradyrhizobium sp. TaxID=376 RepID=UPI001DAC38C4|nr:aldo/keto reductase [Bradyrhizobium sp.]MBI5317914.1 aldo/keto reductase [Bradyrhizobium sp.]
MRYKTFGRQTGLRVSEVALGGGNFGNRLGYGSQAQDARVMFDAYVTAGGNFIDTSENYQFGESEELVGQFIAGRRQEFVIGTKFTQSADKEATLSKTGNSRKNMIYSLEQSLKRLKTDHVDLYWVHMPDFMTPMEEIVRAFDDLARAGKILHAGLSNFPAWRAARGATISDLRGAAPIVAIQIEYSLVERTAERELLPMAEALGLGVATWSPLGGGLLTGKYRSSPEGRAKSLGVLVHRETEQRHTAIIDALFDVAKEIERTPTHVAIGWLRARSARSTTGIVPILGPRTIDQLNDTLDALTVTLSIEQLEKLEQASAFALGVPHEMIGNDYYRTKLSGGKPELFDYPKFTVA